MAASVVNFAKLNPAMTATPHNSYISNYEKLSFWQLFSLLLTVLFLSWFSKGLWLQISIESGDVKKFDKLAKERYSSNAVELWWLSSLSIRTGRFGSALV